LQLALLRQSQGLRGASQALRERLTREYDLHYDGTSAIVIHPAAAVP